MKKANQVSLKRLQSKIKQNYNVDIKEENCCDLIVNEFAKDTFSKEYLKKYIDTYIKDNKLQWACYMYMFLNATEEKSVEKTEKYYKKLKKYKDNYYTENIMADILLRYYGDLFKAKDKYLNALNLKQKDIDCCYNLGVVYYLLGMFDESVKYYQMIVDNEEDSDENIQLKGRALYNIAIHNVNVTKDLKKAEEYLEKAIDKIPDYKDAQDVLEKLKGVI